MNHTTTDRLVIKAWDATVETRDRVPALITSLAGVGIRTNVTTSLSDVGSTLVIVDCVTPELIEVVTALCHGGLDRVIVAWLGDAASIRCDRWSLMRAGAADVVNWHAGHGLHHLAKRIERWHAIDELLRSPLVANHLVGRSSAWVRVLRELVEISHFSDASVLVTGETGTGKELAAKLIHTLDRRAHKKDLVVLDCTTVVPTLSGSEFFGHERGAFTGASNSREGVFAQADGGTLFLDEIGELPLSLQAEVLRAIQEGAYKPVGSNTWRRANFRLVCATHRNLGAEQHGGNFRSDLFHRLSSFQVQLPPLRDRRADIPALFRHFAQAAGRCPVELDDAVEEFLLTREYPGNVRELKQLATQMGHRHTGVGPMTVGSIPPSELARKSEFQWDSRDFSEAVQKAVSMGVGLKGLRRAAEDAAVGYAIALEHGSLQRAAARLGVTPRAIQMRVAGRRQELLVVDSGHEAGDESKAG